MNNAVPATFSLAIPAKYSVSATGFSTTAELTVLTVTSQVSLISPTFAVIVAVPAPTAVTTPLATVATPVALDSH